MKCIKLFLSLSACASWSNFVEQCTTRTSARKLDFPLPECIPHDIFASFWKTSTYAHTCTHKDAHTHTHISLQTLVLVIKFWFVSLTTKDLRHQASDYTIVSFFAGKSYLSLRICFLPPLISLKQVRQMKLLQQKLCP